MLAYLMNILHQHYQKSVDMLWHQSCTLGQILHENQLKELGVFDSIYRHVCRTELGITLDIASFPVTLLSEI